MKNSINIYLKNGLGDALLVTPTIKQLKVCNPKIRIKLLCKFKPTLQIFEHNPYIYDLIHLNSVKGFMYKILIALKLLRYVDLGAGRLWPNILHTEKAAFIMAKILKIEIANPTIDIFLLESESKKAINFLKGFANPIIINNTSLSIENKMWFIGAWADLVAQMPEYSFLQLGSKDEELIPGAIDLLGKTEIRESMALVKHALSFVGLDSFLAHVTNAFDIKGVVLFGPSNPVVWGHENNINLCKNLICAPCMDALRSRCPFGRPCMTGITVEDVKYALLHQINSHKTNL